MIEDQIRKNSEILVAEPNDSLDTIYLDQKYNFQEDEVIAETSSELSSEASTEIENYLNNEEENVRIKKINEVDKNKNNQLFSSSEELTLSVLNTGSSNIKMKDVIKKKEDKKKIIYDLHDIKNIVNIQLSESFRKPTKASLARKRKIKEMFL